MNLRHLHELASNFEEFHGKDLSLFIDYLEVIDEMDGNPPPARIADEDAINLMTIHAAKGLEFSVVFLTNLAKDKFPLYRGGAEPFIPSELMEQYRDIFEDKSIKDTEKAVRERKKEIKKEEERRLAYVALTRAKEHLFLTLAIKYAEDEREPSEFLLDIGYNNWRAGGNITVGDISYFRDTFNDDLDKVKEMGVVLINEDDVGELKAVRIEMRDVDKPALEKALGLFEIELPDKFAVAVQDHGFSPQVSNRVFRFEYFRNIIRGGGTLDSFVYRGNIPGRFSRMKAVERALPGALLMDTGIAAIRGALLDDNANEPCLVVNIGNGHTLACVVRDKKPLSIFEHHTYLMTADKLDDYLERLCAGTLSFREVFDDGGHGCCTREAIDLEKIGSILVTGPNRGIMRNSQLPFRFAAPFGDMMLTGCFGLMDAYINHAGD